VKVLVQALWVKKIHKRAHNRWIAYMIETARHKAIAVSWNYGLVFHDKVYSNVDVGHPEHKIFKLSFFLLNHIRTVRELYQLRIQRVALLTFSHLKIRLFLEFLLAFDINVLICWMLHIFKQTGVLFWIVNRRKNVHGVVFECLILGLVIQFC